MEQQACRYCGNIHEPLTEYCPETGRSLKRSRLRAEWIFLGILGLAVLAAGVSLLLGNDTRPTDLASLPRTSTGWLEQFVRQTVGEIRESEANAASTRGATASTSPLNNAARTAAAGQTQSSELTSSLTQTASALMTGEAVTELVNATRSTGGTAAATPTPREWNACDGAPASRLAVGMRAYVSYVPPLANRVRIEAGTHARILGHIQPGEEITILEGPGCANGWVWWRIRSLETSLTGWTSEGDRNDYWLIPME